MDVSKACSKTYQVYKNRLVARMYHTIKRVRERYNIKLNDFDYFSMIDLIMKNESVCLEKGNGVEIHCLYYKTDNILLVYEPSTESIKTALTKELYK